MQEFIVEFYTEVLMAGERDPQRVSLTTCILSGNTAAQVQADAEALLDGVAANAQNDLEEMLEPEDVNTEVTALDTYLDGLRVAGVILRNDQADWINRAKENEQ